ncbi:hypothetical protein C8R44DRAFT_723799 [Mycena epipterygia]|nr:hypothetical protein C8R44DRAFT_723799 [Mycena epipterygia]
MTTRHADTVLSPLSDVPITEGPATSHDDFTRPIPPGMERGYVMSPMAEIKLKYLEEPEDESSIFFHVSIIVKKKDLAPREVWDRGISHTNITLRFCVETGFIMRIERLIKECQVLLVKAARLVIGRGERNYFVIDPHGSLVGMLKGSDSLDEISIAWKALRQCFELSQHFLEKCFPVSTVPEIYDELSLLTSHLDKLSYLYREVPHHTAKLPEDWQNNSQGYLPVWIEFDSNLTHAFPDRVPEAQLSTVYYYTAEGERKERTIPERSSYRALAGYTPSPEEPLSTRKGKKRVSMALEDSYSPSAGGNG